MLPQVMPEQTLQAIHLIAKDSSSTLPKRMDGKIAIVTGGARGIGEATVRLFVRHGAKVVIADIDDAAGIALADSLLTSVTYLHCDVSLEEDINNLVNFTISKHGRLDILFNNAGVLLGNPSKLKSITDFDANEFDNVIRTNVRGAALGMKYAAKVMVPRRSGCIISTASVAPGLMGGIGPHAIVGLTKNTACELGKYGIRVNCISPSGVANSMLVDAWKSCKDSKEDEEHYSMDLGKPSEEEEGKIEKVVSGLGKLKTRDIAEAAVYLASEESKYVSGHNLVVDGGLTRLVEKSIHSLGCK